jgi:hypothetical protein
MTDEPKLDLSWTQPTDSREPEPYIAFEIFDDAEAIKTAYVVTFRVCPTPRCSCLSVCVYCSRRLSHEAEPWGPLRRFWLNVGKRVLDVTPELKAEPEALSLAQLVSSQLSDKAWEELHRWFWSAKIKAIETADVSMVDVTDLPNADDGQMVPFVEVFPLGLGLNFTFEQADWAADEAFCVQPSCNCTQTVLSFLKLRNAAGEKTAALRDVPAIRYNYGSQATEELVSGTAGTPPTAQLLAALRMSVPSLDSRLGLHHRIMQSLYARQHLKKERLETQLPVEPPRPGRNDPCPCGSGKKCKKCCGA